MSRQQSGGRRSSGWATAVAAGVAGLSAASASASLTINLQLPGGGTSMLIGGGQTNTDIPIQVWATVTGTTTISPVPVAGNSTSNPEVQSGVFDGLQYLYYNVLNSDSTGTEITGGIDTATGEGPTLNTALGLAANGSQAGAVPNTANGISVGSATSIASVAKPRASAALFDNYASFNQSLGQYQERGNDGTNIATTGATASFLLETINFKPTAFNPLTKTTFTLGLPSAALTASAATDLQPSNYFQDVTSQNLGTGKPPASTITNGGTKNGSPTIGTQVVIEDTLAGDANLDGVVNSADLLILAQNYNKTGTTFATGDFNGDGTTNSSDLLLLAQNYNASVSTLTPSVVTALDSTAGASFVAQFKADLAAVAAVPEPTTFATAAAATVGLLARRRRRR